MAKQIAKPESNLPANERAKLREEVRAAVRRAAENAWELAEALQRVEQTESWADTHNSFASYCADEAGWGQRHFQRMTTFASWLPRITKSLTTLSTSSVAPAIGMALLPLKTPEKAITVLRSQLRSPKPLTVARVRTAVTRELGDRQRKGKKRSGKELHEYLYMWSGRLDGLADNLESISDEEFEYFIKKHRLTAEGLAAAFDRVNHALASVWGALPK